MAIKGRIKRLEKLLVARPMGDLERAAIQRQINDLKHPPKGYFFDEVEVERVMVIVRAMCHWKAPFAGMPFVPEPWQEEAVLAPIFGWMHLPKGMSATKARLVGAGKSVAKRLKLRRAAGIFRRFTKGYIEIGRKGGKTFLAAVIAIVLLIADHEEGGEVYSAATTRKQAARTFMDASKILMKSTGLRDYVKVMKQSIVCPKLDAFFHTLSSEAGHEEGLNISGAVIDEYHAHRTAEIHDVIVSGTGSRLQPFILIITTAGSGQKGPCWDEHLYAVNILLGIFQDDSYFCFIACADKGDDWEKEETWIKANPNYGVSNQPARIREAAKKAVGSPRALNSFLRYYLNIWTAAVDGWADMTKWDLCGENYDLESLRGRPCYGGVDLSRIIDLTAFVLVFPPHGKDKYWREWPQFYCPADAIEERTKRDRVPYEAWVRAGLMTATPGAEVDYDFVTRDIERAMLMLDLKQVGFDPYNATKWYQDLFRNGWSEEFLIQVRQGPISLSSGMKALEGLIKGCKIRHPMNDVMTWNMANVVVREDSNENIAPDKKRSLERIDGVSAKVTAMALAMLGGGVKKKRTGGMRSSG